MSELILECVDIFQIDQDVMARELKMAKNCGLGQSGYTFLVIFCTYLIENIPSK